ncbi:hypothetical protein E3_0250 [Rhodococcus phage E3]|uniref:hypothetical protein n=1 Tax=Rhodococcus phage E3 TaxID=1007869 RepID=UPI0002C6E069|nr:hypothetical protein M176_gp026 [Rhodococcus phage E3]AEQ20936.1 hypothetical protein E3_0250 [Rhodococcus phage E3]
MTRYEMPERYTLPVSRAEDGTWYGVVIGPQDQRRTVQAGDYDALLGLVLLELGEVYGVDDPVLHLDVELKILSVPGIPDVQHALQSFRELMGRWDQMRDERRMKGEVSADHTAKARDLMRQADGIGCKLGRTLFLAGVPKEEIARMYGVQLFQVSQYTEPRESNRQRHELLDGTAI